MTPVPLDLPLRPSEAVELASLIFASAEGRRLTDEVRNRVAARAAAQRFETMVPSFGSLERDPVHHSTYYVAVDLVNGPCYLLHMALAAAPTSSIFSKPLLVGRMQRSPGPEIVINAIPFAPTGTDALEKFTGQINQAFLPRPRGTRAAVTAEVTATSDFDAIFHLFSSYWKRTRRNLAAISSAADDAPAVYYRALHAAIRAGWRDGFDATVRLAAPLDAAKQAAREAIRFSTFAFDPGALIGDAGDAQARFGEALEACERLRDHIRQTRSAMKINGPFDFALSLEKIAMTPGDLAFCLESLKSNGHAAQMVSLHPADAADKELATVCRQFGCRIEAPRQKDAESVARALEPEG